MFYQNKKYSWAIIILLLCNTVAVAQHYKKVGLNSDQGFMVFDSSGSFSSYDAGDYKWCSFYAKSNGDPWFYFDGNAGAIRYDKTKEIIANGTVKLARLNPIMQLTDSTYLLYHYDRSKDTGFIIKAGKQLQIVEHSLSFNAKSAGNLMFQRISKYKYLLVTKNGGGPENWSKCHIHILDNNGVRLTDSISIDSSFFRQPIQKMPLGLNTYTFYGDMIMNNNASKLYLRIAGRGRYSSFPIYKQFLEAEGIVEIDIDANGKVTSGMRKLRYREDYDLSADKDADLHEGVGLRTISPNNKLLYYSVFSLNEGSSEQDSVKSYRLDLETILQYPIQSEYTEEIGVFMGKSPYGYIYETIGYQDRSKPDEGRVIYNSNESSSKVNFSNIVPIDRNDYSYIKYLTPYDYMKLYHTIDYDCGATVRFQNKTDQSAGMDSFTWHFTREDGSLDTMSGFEPAVSYTKSGDYFYKVLGLSQEGREYGEWFIDTLKIRIPEKPVAAFTAVDTVICAYAPLEFTNQSTTDTIHQTNGEKWVWTFGDGTTETVSRPFDSAQDDLTPPSVTHVYETPGTYTVSLFYSNGFCDSTLVKNQYITVVDAPAPGFSIDNNRGCSPFTVNITDTITKNTTKKEYNYYDGTGWVDVPVNQREFNHTYIHAGNYWITQRLYGYTGCVTQLDSVRIYVTPGFTVFDTSHITNATYQDVPAQPTVPEIVTVNWQCLLEGAPVSYHLYRNNQKIAELDPQPCIYGQIVYPDSLEQSSNSPLTYTVVVIDSCGTATQVGRVGQPVHVSGEVVGHNELSIVTYTAYQDWNVGESELRYELQTENNLGGWETINDQTGTAPYRDREFLSLSQSSNPSTQPVQSEDEVLRMTSLEKCYRVIAKGTSHTSFSNILCLPYAPVIFLPTAFSPNGDNLNDVYRPVTFGIEHYQMKIYNRYGEKIAAFTEQDGGWQAIDAPLGAYMVTIRAKGTDNEWHNLKQTVTVVR